MGITRTRTVVVPLKNAEPLATLLERVLAAEPSFDLYVRDNSLGDPLIKDSQHLSRLYSQLRPDLLILCVSQNALPQIQALIEYSRNNHRRVSIVVIVEDAAPGQIANLLNLGVDDFILAPLRPSDVLARLSRIQRHIALRNEIVQVLKEKMGLCRFIGESPAFIAQTKKIPSIAKSDANVLITGETGTGKEVTARAIHYLSPRASKPFVPVNCGAIPLELAENELFGHRRGAFTGALASHAGLIAEANGGTLFLDEINCMPLVMQVKLLRFLQDKEFRPLGSSKSIQADVRIISAANTDLEAAIRLGKLRQDLYYRLNTVSVRLPPLRERRDDIPLLARHFVAKAAAKTQTEIKEVSPGALQKLAQHDWPGNIRELEHVIERALVLSEHGIIGEPEIDLPDGQKGEPWHSFREAKANAVRQFERTYIQEMLLTHRGNITKAAQGAKKNRRAFWQLLKKHQIDAQGYRLAVD